MCNQSVKEKLLWGILGFPLCHLTQLMHVVIIMRNLTDEARMSTILRNAVRQTQIKICIDLLLFHNSKQM